MTIFASTEEQISRRSSHGRDFQSMLDGVDEGCVEEAGHPSGKKRRLSLDQVKALEKNFEVENKLEPERKVKLAQEIGLQPRQVAVWFQNRRARWKTKQLERDYGVLRTNYDALKLSYDNLNDDNQALRKQMKELKWRVVEEKRKSEAYCVVGGLKEKEGYSESDSSGILNEEDKCSPKCFQWETLNFSISTWAENNFLTPDEACNFFSDEQPPTLHSG